MNAEDIRDIKPPLFFASNYAFLIIIAGAALLIILVFLLVRYWRKRALTRPRRMLVPKPAHQIAYEALQALQAKNLPGLGKIKEYYYELSDIIRHYIENRFDIRAPEMTTEEFLFSLSLSDELASAHKDLLKDFLNLCDIVKFAKYGPTGQEIQNSFYAAKKLVDETKVAQGREEKVLVR
jgi:hypothetical protein